MLVRNVNGTAVGTCACGNWLSHWAKYGGQTIPGYCPEVNCVSKVATGALVQSGDSGDPGWYVVPLCAEHAAQTGQDLNISNAIKPVSANVSATCGA